jgi:hypothetical protein
MYPNKGRLLEKSALRDGYAVREWYSNASKGSWWGPEEERLKGSGCWAECAGSVVQGGLEGAAQVAVS